MFDHYIDPSLIRISWSPGKGGEFAKVTVKVLPCKNLLAIAPRSRRDDRDRGAMAAIAARLCISRRDLD